MGAWLDSTTKQMIDFPSLSNLLSLAPQSRSARKASKFPFTAAVMIGVYKFLSVSSALAPLHSNDMNNLAKGSNTTGWEIVIC